MSQSNFDDNRASSEIIKVRNDSNFTDQLNVNGTQRLKSTEIEQPRPAPGMQVEDLTARHLFNYITNEDPEGLLSFLKRNHEFLNVIDMKDALDFNLLCYCAFRNEGNCMKVLVRYVQNQKGKDWERMAEWANYKNAFGFSAIHYGAETGSYLILTLLVEEANADIYQKNRMGSTVLHISAQKDQPLSLYYFWQRGMDINILDDKGSTALHWACYMRSEMALTYILTMKPNLEAKDCSGFTPLHIAVSQTERLDSTRNVRVLLLRGADRDSLS